MHCVSKQIHFKTGSVLSPSTPQGFPCLPQDAWEGAATEVQGTNQKLTGKWKWLPNGWDFTNENQTLGSGADDRNSLRGYHELPRTAYLVPPRTSWPHFLFHILRYQMTTADWNVPRYQAREKQKVIYTNQHGDLVRATWSRGTPTALI